MPIYEYQCQLCLEVEERLHSISQDHTGAQHHSNSCLNEVKELTEAPCHPGCCPGILKKIIFTAPLMRMGHGHAATWTGDSEKELKKMMKKNKRQIFIKK